MDFLVITGVISDLNALRLVSAVQKGIKNKLKRNALKAAEMSDVTPGDVSATTLLTKLQTDCPTHHLINVSLANMTFMDGIFYWPISSESIDNIHYIEGIPICSNETTKFQLAIFHLLGKEGYEKYALKLAQFEDTVNSKSQGLRRAPSWCNIQCIPKQCAHSM